MWELNLQPDNSLPARTPRRSQPLPRKRTIRPAGPRTPGHSQPRGAGHMNVRPGRGAIPESPSKKWHSWWQSPEPQWELVLWRAAPRGWRSDPSSEVGELTPGIGFGTGSGRRSACLPRYSRGAGNLSAILWHDGLSLVHRLLSQGGDSGFRASTYCPTILGGEP